MHMSEMRMTEVLVPIAASTDRLVQTVKALNDTEVSGKTLVPPWTRGHVITHVARAADSLCRLLTWARTGVETPQYAGLDARAAEIEAGARRPVHELVADVVASAERFDDAIRSLPGGAWSHEVRMRTGELRTPEALASARLRELEVHHVDLAAGYRFAEVPPPTARLIIDDLVDAQRRREGVPPLRIEATDTDLTHELGTGGPTIRGTQADLLGWLTGRTTGATLTTSRPGPVPTAPYWI